MHVHDRVKYNIVESSPYELILKHAFRCRSPRIIAKNFEPSKITMNCDLISPSGVCGYSEGHAAMDL